MEMIAMQIARFYCTSCKLSASETRFSSFGGGAFFRKHFFLLLLQVKIQAPDGSSCDHLHGTTQLHPTSN